MATNRDFSDLFAALNAAGARYLVVGGYALAFHSAPRFTKDLDVWIDRSPDNAARVYRALGQFGAPLDRLEPGDLAADGVVFQMGVAPSRIDLLTAIDGVEFDEAWDARCATSYGDQAVHVIGRDHLRRNKLAAGRPQDLIDAGLLRD